MGGTLGGVQKDMDEGFSKVGGKVEEGLGMVSHAGQGYEGIILREIISRSVRSIRGDVHGIRCKGIRREKGSDVERSVVIRKIHAEVRGG